MFFTRCSSILHGAEEKKSTKSTIDITYEQPLQIKTCLFQPSITLNSSHIINLGRVSISPVHNVAVQRRSDSLKQFRCSFFLHNADRRLHHASMDLLDKPCLEMFIRLISRKCLLEWLPGDKSIVECELMASEQLSLINVAMASFFNRLEASDPHPINWLPHHEW